MKFLISSCLALFFTFLHSANAEAFDPENFANVYFDAWAATQSPTATPADIEVYLSLLADDVGHQHLPYDTDDTRSPEGKNSMREGMSHYLGAHTEYTGELISYLPGYDVLVIEYDTSIRAIHPQTEEVITDNYRTLEVLEIEDGKVSVIRKYSE